MRVHTLVCVHAWSSVGVTNCSNVLEHQVNIRQIILIWSAYGIEIVQSGEA